MKRYALLMLVIVLFAAGCKAGTTRGVSAVGKPAPVSDEQIYEKMQPFLECSYVEYARLGREQGFTPQTADMACETCSGMLSIYVDFLVDRTDDLGFARRQAKVLVSYARRVIAEGTEKAGK